MQVNPQIFFSFIVNVFRQRLLICIYLLCVNFSFPSFAIAQENDNATDAVTSLKAYAQFKSGNYQEARAIWQKLADKGNTTALINLANLFQQGIGVDKNQLKALSFIQQAAKLGDARAQYELGMEYEKGILVKRDIKKAASLHHLSAQQDNADGQFAYGIMMATNYGKGFSTTSPTQLKAALMWLTKSKENRHPDAADYIRLLVDSDKKSSQPIK